MKKVVYSKNSPYADTGAHRFFLDTWKPRTIPKLSSDKLYEVAAVYQYRPDLLAYDLYGDAGLWWVFAMRNPNVIEDPIYDFTAGSTIFVPSKATLQSALGI